MTAYCAAVLPHSEISGSTLICSSPKLIAACHVLHRLLMPRHSPCALLSLTCVEENAVFFALVLYQELCRLNRIVKTKLYLPFRQRKLRFPPSALRRTSGPLRFLFLSNPNPLALGFGFAKAFPQLKFFRCGLSTAPSVALLFSHFLCSVFKVQVEGVPSKLNNVRFRRLTAPAEKV